MKMLKKIFKSKNETNDPEPVAEIKTKLKNLSHQYSNCLKNPSGPNYLQRQKELKNEIEFYSCYLHTFY